MEFLSKRLRRLSKLYIQSIAKEIPELHIEYYVDIILLLASSELPVTQKELANILHIDKSRVTILIDGLVHLQYISKKINLDDKREHFAFLTEKGKELVPAIKAAMFKINNRINGGLDKKELANFYAVLLQMELNLSEIER